MSVRGRLKASWKALRGYPTIFGLRGAYVIFPQKHRVYDKPVQIIDCPKTYLGVADEKSTTSVNGGKPRLVPDGDRVLVQDHGEFLEVDAPIPVCVKFSLPVTSDDTQYP